MKKFKIFLLLSILLCFGFALSFEVHANGPKVFEVNDVLPEHIKVSCPANLTMTDFNLNPGLIMAPSPLLYIKTNSNSYQLITYSIDDEPEEIWVDCYFYNNSTYYSIYEYYYAMWMEAPEFDLKCKTPTYKEVDLSGLSIAERTVSSVDYPFTLFTWEEISQGYNVTYEENGGTTQTDLTGQTALPTPLPTPIKTGYTFLGWFYDSDFTNEAFAGDSLTSDVTLYAKWGPGKIFEVTDVLPQGIIRISWDETAWFRMAYVLGDPGGNQILSSNNSFDLLDYIYPQVLTYPEPGYLEFIPPYTVYGGGHAYIDIDTSEWDLSKRTISTVFWREQLTSRLYWEDITPDGYTQGYQAAKEYYGWEDGGYWYTGEEAWYMGNDYARAIYGYYDPITNQWLSVSEYLELYGTDKMSQTDFYNNFDKYFIPAMIIVFGGAIVLTLLKVFKGRE